MSDFEKRFGNLTVEEVLELNKKAEETCTFEITAVQCKYPT